jgi:hypothetical protein
MRSFLVLGLLIAVTASAQAATAHYHYTRHHVFISPRVASSFDALPGWSESPRSAMRYDDAPPSYNDPSKFGGSEALPIRQ